MKKILTLGLVCGMSLALLGGLVLLTMPTAEENEKKNLEIMRLAEQLSTFKNTGENISTEINEQTDNSITYIIETFANTYTFTSQEIDIDKLSKQLTNTYEKEVIYDEEGNIKIIKYVAVN